MNTVHINVFLTISESLKVIKCSGIVSCYSFGWGTVHGVFQLIYEFNDLSMWHSKTWSKWHVICLLCIFNIDEFIKHWTILLILVKVESVEDFSISQLILLMQTFYLLKPCKSCQICKYTYYKKIRAKLKFQQQQNSAIFVNFSYRVISAFFKRNVLRNLIIFARNRLLTNTFKSYEQHPIYIYA